LLNKPLKRFGQNYLIDKNIINKIVTEINPQPNDTIIEIGPGRGALTGLLVNKLKDFSAVEIDRRVIEALSMQYPSLKIINEDFLKMDLQQFFKNNRIKIVGNIPYNITSSIIFKIIENRKFVQESVFMVQNEVAKRMSAKIRTKDYGILSVLLSAFGQVEYCFKVSPNVFRPRPNVHSAVVHIRWHSLSFNVSDNLIIQIVKAAFGNRRKTLKNSLNNSIFNDCDFSKLGIDLSRRAEELETKEFIQLAKAAEQIKSK